MTARPCTVSGLTRRTMIFAVAGSAASLSARSQALREVKILVVRALPQLPGSECSAPCIRGKIFDVSEFASFSDVVLATILLRQPICDTIERPWANNALSVSSIPREEYQAKIRTDASKEWMNNENKWWRLELQGTSPRSAIQFHYGNDVKWSEGCFIVGDALGSQDGISKSNYCSLTGGEAAVQRLREAVMAPGNDTSRIRVGVSDGNGLWPNFKPAPDCPGT